MKSYLKFLSRNKLYTAIEAVGLAVSLAFVILIGSYVVQQYEVAHESPDWKRTFVLGSDEFLGLTYWDKEELEMNIPAISYRQREPCDRGRSQNLCSRRWWNSGL